MIKALNRMWAAHLLANHSRGGSQEGMTDEKKRKGHNRDLMKGTTL